MILKNILQYHIKERRCNLIYGIDYYHWIPRVDIDWRYNQNGEKIKNKKLFTIKNSCIMKFDNEKFIEWERNTHIPERILTMANAIAKEVGCGEIFEDTISIYNRGGQVIGWAKGFILTHCTSSYSDGPSTDYSKEMAMWLKGLGFVIENSYGDNGMDSSTNWHDTYWTNEFIYKPTEIFEEQFIIWEDGDYEE